MSPRFALFVAWCVLIPILRADDQPLSEEPLILPGTFEASDAGSQPVALWLERGDAVITSPSAEVAAASLALPAQVPGARVCLLLNAPDAQVTAISLRLRLAHTGAGSAPETIEWELSGVPLRFTGDEAGLWRTEFHTAQEGWRPLLSSEGEDLGAGWHTLTIEFAGTAPRSWRLRWDAREAGSWIPEARPMAPLLVIDGGAHTTVWLDDIATVENAIVPPENSNPADAAAARIVALRQEIADALRDLERETGVRRLQVRRQGAAIATRPAQAAGGARQSGLTVLTNLENQRIEPQPDPSMPGAVQ